MMSDNYRRAEMHKKNRLRALKVIAGVTPEFGENSTLRNLVEYF